jgi:serine/threonine-protein kinase
MTRHSSSQTRWFAKALGFGSVPGSPEEVRAFLQLRVSLFLALMGALWLIMLALDAVARFTTPVPLAEAATDHARVIAYALLAVALGLLWLVSRRGSHGLPILGTLDATATVAQGVALGALLFAFDPRLLPESGALLALSQILVARAALVPSRAARTAVVGGLAAVPIVVGRVASRHHAALPDDLPSVAQLGVNTLLWCGIVVLSSSVISYVIYGLHQRARAAQQLGQYTLEEKIGEGGMGVVYRARHAFLRRPTAIKLLAPDRNGDNAAARFEREVQLTSRLTHPNTIAVFDYGRTPDGVFYYAMEYLDGIDLETLVSTDGPQPAARVIHVLRQAAGALAEAHHVGLIHRDVKPANLLLCQRGLLNDFVKVLDFGLVRVMGDDSGLSTTNMLLGTPLYMSPEHIRSTDAIDARSDLYALGAVGFFLLTGTPPFPGDSVLEVCRKHLHENAVPPSTKTTHPVPASLDRLIVACLDKSKEGRPTDARALQLALEQCASEAPWTEAQAEDWWKQRGAGLARERKSRLPNAQIASTLAVDLVGRGQRQSDQS